MNTPLSLPLAPGAGAYRSYIVGADGNPCLLLWVHSDPPEFEAEAAEFICERVNGYDALKSACRKALPEIRCLYQQLTSKRAEDADGPVGEAIRALTAVLDPGPQTLLACTSCRASWLVPITPGIAEAARQCPECGGLGQEPVGGAELAEVVL